MASTRSDGFLTRPIIPIVLGVLAMTGIGGELFAADRSGGEASPFVFSRPDSLFLTAATGEPRFAGPRDSCERELLAHPAETIAYLLATADADRTPRQRHYVERLLVAISDSGRNAAARDAVAGAIRGTATASSDTVRARWLYLGSRLGDTAFRAVARPWLESGSPLVRRMAARALGAAPAPENVPLLRAGLDTLHGLELHQRLWALDAHGPVGDPGALVPLLRDAAAFNRRMVRTMLLRATDGSWERLRPLLADAPPRERRLLARAAEGGAAFLKAERGLMTDEERAFYRVE